MHFLLTIITINGGGLNPPRNYALTFFQPITSDFLLLSALLPPAPFSFIQLVNPPFDNIPHQSHVNIHSAYRQEIAPYTSPCGVILNIHTAFCRTFQSHNVFPLITSSLDMHTFFALEDMYGLKISEVDGEVCLRLDKSYYSTYSSMDKMLLAWQQQAAKLENSEITKEEYDEWRYKYPELDTYQRWAKVIPEKLNDYLIKDKH